MEKYLVPPKKSRETGCVVENVPKNFTEGKHLHRIYDPEKNPGITFIIRSIMSYVPLIITPEEEINSCKRVKIKSEEELENITPESGIYIGYVWVLNYIFAQMQPIFSQINCSDVTPK